MVAAPLLALALGAVAPPAVQTAEPPAAAETAPLPPPGLLPFRDHLPRVEGWAEYAWGHAKYADARVVMHPGEPAVEGYARLAHQTANAWALLATAYDGTSRLCYGDVCNFWMPDGRDDALAHLEKLIGPEAFAAGAMPPPCPAWGTWP